MAGANSLHFTLPSRNHHATITQPRELMRKIPHYMSWKAIFNTVVCFGKKICLTHEAVTIVTVLWVHKESLFTVISRDCPAKQQLTQIDSLKVKRNFTYRRSLFFRFKFSPWTEAKPQGEKRRRQETAQMARYGRKPKSLAISTHERCDET